MKCDELKVIRIELDNHGKPIASIQGTTSYFGISRCDEFYPKSEADAAITELKADNRELKRALWLARAERAKNMQTNRVFLKDYLREHKNSWLSKDKELAWDLFKEAFEIVEHKCRAKAEEYK